MRWPALMPCGAGEPSASRRAGEGSVGSALRQRDLTPERQGIDGRASPFAVRLGRSFKSLNQELLGTRGGGNVDTRRRASDGISSGIESLSSMFEFDGVEGRRVVEDGLLAAVEFAEVMAVEVVEAACEVAVGLEARVVPCSPGVGA